MNINTSTIIKSIQKDIQNKIDIEQKKLLDIKKALCDAQQFLLESGYEEIKETSDVLQETIETIKKIKKQNIENNKDIENINKSIQSLKSVKNTVIDKSVIENLEKKIIEIKENIKNDNQKLKTTDSFLNILLNLYVVCPACNKEDKNRFNHCNYCDGSGFLNIGRILTNEGIIDPSIINFNNAKKIPTPATENLQNLKCNKYLISKE